MHAAVSNVRVNIGGILFREELKKGGPKFTIYLVPPFYVNGSRPAIGLRSQTGKLLYLSRVLFSIAEIKRLFCHKEKKILLNCPYSAGI
jgi:hypothetical protein